MSIEIDGIKYDSLDDAQVYLDTKRKEETEQLMKKEVEGRKEKIAKWVSSNLYFSTVVLSEGESLGVCVFCDDKDVAKISLQAKIVETFGEQYSRSEDKKFFIPNYEVVGNYKPTNALKSEIVSFLMGGKYSISEGKLYGEWSSEGLAAMGLSGVCMESFVPVIEELELPESDNKEDELDALISVLSEVFGAEPVILRGILF